MSSRGSEAQCRAKRNAYCWFLKKNLPYFRGPIFTVTVPQGAVAVPRGQVLSVGADAHGPNARAVLGRLRVGLFRVAAADRTVSVHQR